MSSSEPHTCIVMTDDAKTIKDKINKYALSGGRQTVEEHRKLGADLSVDIPCEYLEFFLEDDDKLQEIKDKYSKGEMLTGEVKTILADVITKYVEDFQARRAKITDEMVDHFMKVRTISPNPDKFGPELAKRAELKKKQDEEKAKLKKEKAEKQKQDEAANKEKKEKKKAEDAKKKAITAEFARIKKE